MSKTAQVTDIYRFGDTPEVDELWVKSQVLRYGADSHTRLLDQGSPGGKEQFPVCKLATNDRQRQFIVDEVEILYDLGSKAAPVVRVHPEPLVDGKGIFGFRMEKLLAIGPDTAVSKSDFIKCLEQIHEKGIVHNGFHPGNVMINGEGQLVVIDFGRSGRVGSNIPTEKRSPWWRAELYSFEADYISLNKFFCGFQTRKKK
ncbi:hypothetical protein MFIFM68171_01953 [Madurella fahalii]|uniref:ABC1 atypical kinase-like domain-containing protein n=1 Tax=Madurella fahalii TaxID=1157608 RepID=A0ABQ0G1V7_9PEZI